MEAKHILRIVIRVGVGKGSGLFEVESPVSDGKWKTISTHSSLASAERYCESLLESAAPPTKTDPVLT